MYPRSLWSELRDALASDVDGLTMGDVTDFAHFMGAVIDERAFAKHADVLEAGRVRRRRRGAGGRHGRRQ